VKLPEADLADMAFFIKQLRIVLPILGFDLFRPAGSRNKVTAAVESLMGQYAQQVTARMVKRAVDGDVGAARLILDRGRVGSRRGAGFE
jgi:hypothetical protein